MPVLDTAVMVTQLIDMVVQGVAPAFRKKAKQVLLSKKRDILSKFAKSEMLRNKLENWYSRKTQVDADLLMRSAGFGGSYQHFLDVAEANQKSYDKTSDYLNIYQAKLQDKLSKTNKGMDAIDMSSPFSAKKISDKTVTAVDNVDENNISLKKVN